MYYYVLRSGICDNVIWYTIKTNVNIVLYFMKPLTGIVSRDFLGLQMILMDRFLVDPLHVYYFILPFHTVFYVQSFHWVKLFLLHFA